MAASESINKAITSASEQEFYYSSGWTHVWLSLESAAGGKNEMSYGGAFVLVEPGQTVSHVIAPGTRIKIRTTSGAPVNWSILVTQLTMIDDLLKVLCG